MYKYVKDQKKLNKWEKYFKNGKRKEYSFFKDKAVNMQK